MSRDPNHEYSTDERDSSTLAAIALRDGDEADRVVGILHYRGTQVEFDIARALSDDSDPERRSLSAYILGQLGWSERTFLVESVDLLLLLLADADVNVVAAAAYGLGFRNHPAAILPLLQYVEHPDAMVRRAVVSGLSRHDDLAAIGGLIELSRDADPEVRDWATFGLASMTPVDTAELREALIARVSDEEAEIRGEALIGLASRRHPDVGALIRDELNRPFAGDWSIEAAELLADPSLHTDLEAVWETLSTEDQAHFKHRFDAALDACRAQDDSSRP